MSNRSLHFFQKLWPGIVFLLLIIGLLIKLLPFAQLHDAVFIVILCILLFAFSITYGLKFVFSPYEASNDSRLSFFKQYKYELGLFLVLIITTLPLLVKSYFYYDDWTLVGNPFFPCKENLIILGRPIHILFFTTLDKVNITNAYFFKWVFLFAVILYAFVLYRWLFQLTSHKLLAFLVSVVLSVFAPLMDLLGYTAIGVITYSVLFAALSVVSFNQAWEALQRRKFLNFILHTGSSILLLFTACLTYQLGPQIVFLFLVIELFLSVKSKPVIHRLIRKHFSFLLVFAFSFGAYLLFIRALTQLNNFAIISDRSQIINSLAQVQEKLNFYGQVFKQGIMQVGTALSGNAFVSQRYHGYYISYSHPLTGSILYYLIILVILLAFASYVLKTRSILGSVALAIYLPMSYFSFLILSASEYLVGYAFAHISILMFFFTMGLLAISKGFGVLLQKLRSRETPLLSNGFLSVVLIPLVLLCAWVSNSYVRDFYINFNSQLYAYVKGDIQSALSSNELERIHIVGLVSPINADVYSLLVVQTALADLGENVGEFDLTYSRTKHYLARIEEEYYLELVANLSAGDRSLLESFYVFEPTYSQYNLSRIPSAEEEAQLSDIFMRSGAIPQVSSSKILLIDLTWTDTAYYNHR